LFKKLRRLFGFKESEKSLEDRLFANVFMPREPRDYFKWFYNS
jgi:hypothetical protein